MFGDCVRDTPNDSLGFVMHRCCVVFKNVLQRTLHQYYVTPVALTHNNSSNYITNCIGIMLYQPPSSAAAATTTSQIDSISCYTSRPPLQQQQLHHKLDQHHVIPTALARNSSNNYTTDCIYIVLYQPLSPVVAVTTTPQIVSKRRYTNRSHPWQQQ